MCIIIVGGIMKKVFALSLFFLCFNVGASNKFNVKLDKCIDGDTAKFIINGESKTVRFLSINAPEIAHDDVEEEFYGKEASEYTCKLLKRSSVIKLQYDSKSDKVDKYDRVLAWVFVDDELLQKKLIEGGYAEVKYVYNKYLYSDELKDLEVVAKNKKIGMWGNSVSDKSFDIPSLHDLLIYGFCLIIILILYIIKKLIRKK